MKMAEAVFLSPMEPRSPAPPPPSQAVLTAFDAAVADLSSIEPVRRYALERMYEPGAAATPGVHPEEGWLTALRKTVSETVAKATVPAAAYAALYGRWHALLNQDADAYIATLPLELAAEDDDDGGDGDGDDDSSAGGSTAPVKEVRVNLEALTAILQEHMDAKAALLSDIPETAMDCGLFAVGTADVRAVLVAKHTAVVGKLLAGHAINCTTTASAINLKVCGALATRPANYNSPRSPLQVRHDRAQSPGAPAQR